jgi:hypothetical protein
MEEAVSQVRVHIFRVMMVDECRGSNSICGKDAIGRSGRIHGHDS